MPRPQAFEDCQIMDRAVALFWEKGYLNTSAQNMVDSLGLNRSSIYNTYSDKKTLFLRAMQHYRKHQTQSLLQILDTCPPTLETLRTLLETVAFSSLDALTCKGCLVVNSAIEFGQHDEAVLAIITENIEEVVAAFGVFIEKGQQLGHFNSRVPAHDLAIFLFHNMTAMRVTTKVLKGRDFFQSNIEMILRTFIQT